MLVEPVFFTNGEHLLRRKPGLLESAKRRHLTRNRVIVLSCRDWVHRQICEVMTIKCGFVNVLCVDRQVVEQCQCVDAHFVRSSSPDDEACNSSGTIWSPQLPECSRSVHERAFA